MIGTNTHRRVVLTFLDQVVSSASNFATGLVVARLSGPAEFGRYMLVLMIWLIVVGVHRSLIAEPVIVTARQMQDQRSLIAHGVTGEILLGLTVSVLVASLGLGTLVFDTKMAVTILALAPWLVPLLIQDYWRAMAFRDRRPGLALANDLVFDIVQITAIVVLAAGGRRTAPYMLSAWGLGATAGGLLGFYWWPAIGRLRQGVQLVRRVWPLSRWLLSDFLTSFGSHQAYLIFAALLISQQDYGGFRAALNLMGPAIVFLHSGANVGLPEASRLVDPSDPTALKRFARRLTALTFACIAAYAALVAIGGGRLMALIYGPPFRRFAPLATLAAAQYVIAVSWFGQGIALKASGRIRRLWRARFVVGAGSLLLMVVLVRWFGTNGAAWTGVATDLAYAIAVYSVYRSEMRYTSGDEWKAGGPTGDWPASCSGAAIADQPIPE